MKRSLLTSSWIALAVGLGVAAPLWADADKPPNRVPFCGAEAQTRVFPCRGANLTTVQDEDQLMSIGGGVPPEWRRAQDRATQPPAPTDVQADQPQPSQDDDRTRTKAERKEDRKAKRQAEKDRQAQEKRDAEAQAEKDRQAQEKRDAEAQAEKDRQAQEKRDAEAQAEKDRQAQEKRDAEAQAEKDRQAQEKRDAEAQADSNAAEKSARDLRAEEERQARRAARRAERRAAAAAAGGGATPTDVEEQVVTPDSVRSSDEEFDTKVAGAGPSAPAAAGGNDGLSDLGKLALLGLGAVAVGTLLNNGDEVVANSGDRVVVRRDGDLAVLKNDDALLRRPGDTVRTERFADGSTRETLTRTDGQRVVTVRAADGAVLRRTLIFPNGNEYVLFDDTREVEAVDLDRLPARPAEPQTAARSSDEAALRLALAEEMRNDSGRRFSLEQIRTIAPVRYLAPEIEVDAITFATGSAAIAPDQARNLVDLGRELSRLVQRRPETVLLIEGHTDAVGDAVYNLALSDRRAESVALALTEYFAIPPENMVIQGYGEQLLKVPTLSAEPRNRRAAVRNITALLR